MDKATRGRPSNMSRKTDAEVDYTYDLVLRLNTAHLEMREWFGKRVPGDPDLDCAHRLPVVALIREARSMNMTWREIAESVEMTHQSVRKWYLRWKLLA